MAIKQDAIIKGHLPVTAAYKRLDEAKFVGQKSTDDDGNQIDASAVSCILGIYANEDHASSGNNPLDIERTSVTAAELGGKCALDARPMGGTRVLAHLPLSHIT